MQVIYRKAVKEEGKKSSAVDEVKRLDGVLAVVGAKYGTFTIVSKDGAEEVEDSNIVAIISSGPPPNLAFFTPKKSKTAT